MKIIMMHGHPAAGKSTAAGKIAGFIGNAKVISSAKIRLSGKLHGSTAAFVDETVARTRLAKDKAYRKLCLQAAACVKSGIVPVLDATFHKAYRRRWVYSLAKSLFASVYVVWVVNSKVSSHLKRRGKSKAALHTLAQYDVMVAQSDLLSKDELKSCFVVKYSRPGISFPGMVDSFARKLGRVIS